MGKIIRHPESGKKVLFTGPSPRGFHRLQSAARCLQLYAYENHGPQPPKGVPAPPLARGTLIHVAMAQHYSMIQAYQQGGDPSEYATAYEAIDLIASMEGTEKHAQLAKDAYTAYCAFYPPEQEAQEMQILLVEDLVETMIGGKYLLTGRIDLAYKDLSGRVFVVDHKTAARVTARHKVFYGVHGQLFAYRHMAAQKYGAALAGFKVNMIQHTNPKFERFDLPRAPHLERHFERNVTDLEELIEAWEAKGRPYDEWPMAMNELSCYHRYGPCAFLEKCQRGRSAMKYGDFKIDFSV